MFQQRVLLDMMDLLIQFSRTVQFRLVDWIFLLHFASGTAPVGGNPLHERERELRLYQDHRPGKQVQ